MSVWQTPVATRRTSTSPACGSWRSTSWTTSGAPNSSNTAARILVMRRDTSRMWVLFDLNGTLTDPAVLLDPPELGIAALDEANMMAMITVIDGRAGEFKTLRDAALRRGLERAGRNPAEAEQALARLPEMPAYPDVPEALEALKDFDLAILTQSSVEAAETVLTNAGIREHFKHVLSSTGANTFKPEDLAYAYALEQVGATEAWFVAGHWWDIAGAAYAGLKTAWCSRTDLAYPVAMPQPDVRGAAVQAIAKAILGMVAT